MMQQGNCMPIQEALISALQAGLQIPGGDEELAAMGVRSASIAALRTLSPSHLNQLRGRPVLTLSVDHAALTGSMCVSAAAGLIQRGASNAMLCTVLGLSRSEISAQRTAIGIPAPTGRTALPLQSVRERILSVYQANAALPRAERLIATHDAVPMYKLAQIWAIVGLA